MIAPSGVCRIPRAEPIRPSEELARFARLEYGGGNLGWMTRASAPAQPILGLRRWVSSLVHRPKPAAAPRPMAPGVAAVHFAGEVTRPAAGVVASREVARQGAPMAPAVALAGCESEAGDELGDCRTSA